MFTILPNKAWLTFAVVRIICWVDRALAMCRTVVIGAGILLSLKTETIYFHGQYLRELCQKQNNTVKRDVSKTEMSEWNPPTPARHEK